MEKKVQITPQDRSRWWVVRTPTLTPAYTSSEGHWSTLSRLWAISRFFAFCHQGMVELQSMRLEILSCSRYGRRNATTPTCDALRNHCQYGLVDGLPSQVICGSRGPR